MWTGFVTLALASGCALFALQEQHDDQQLTMQVHEAAIGNSMAVYRDAVVRFAQQYPSFQGRVQDAQLSLPGWYAAPDPGLWSNHVGADGLIAVYATRLPRVNIAEAMATLAHGSELAGYANRAQGRIEPATHSGGAVALPTIPGFTIPDGAPVWLAHRN